MDGSALKLAERPSSGASQLLNGSPGGVQGFVRCGL